MNPGAWIKGCIKDMKIKIIFISIVITYVLCYCCIYNSYVVFGVSDILGFNPEYRSVDMIGTEYSHAYVHVLGCDLFLNPFREYDDTYRVDDSTDEFIKRYSNWGQLYVPILDEFVTIWYVGAN